MGKVIHTKDGRTLMKGPDGRWMSAGKAAEKSLSYDSSKSKTYKTKGVVGAKKSAEEMLGTSLTVHEKRRSAIDTTYELRDKNNEVVGTILQGNTSRDSKTTLYSKRAAKTEKQNPVKKTEKSKSLSFEKREGLGLNPSEYKLSNGDGISPKSLNPNEGNPTNIKQLKDIPGRTSRHTDEIIVKSNYGDKEYVVTREHYQDAKTGYHKAEVVDIRQRVENKEKAPAKKESFKAKERTDYINNISRLRNNGDKKDEDWRVVRQTLDHAPTGTVMIEKGERGSERQYKKLADGSWEYITGSYKGEKTDSKTMSMGWAGHTGMSPSIEFTTEKKMAAAKTKAQKLPKFVENAKSPATVVTKTGNQMLLDLGNSDFTAVNVRTLEKQGWKRRGTSDLTWYKNV